MLSDEPHTRHKALYLPKSTYKVQEARFPYDLQYQMLVAGHSST
jgi:hypothetical protein